MLFAADKDPKPAPDSNTAFRQPDLAQKKNTKRDTHGGTRTHSLEMFARRVEVSRATDCATRADLSEAVGAEPYDSARCALGQSILWN